MEALGVLIGVMLVLGFLALIGHGIWVLCAALFRGVFGGSSGESAPPPTLFGSPYKEQCPVCGAQFPNPRNSCKVCGWPDKTPAPGDRAEIAVDAIQRTVARFQRLQWLDRESALRLNQALDDVLSPSVPLSDSPPTTLLPIVAAQPATPPASPATPPPPELVGELPDWAAPPMTPPPVVPPVVVSPSLSNEPPIIITPPADDASIPLAPASAAQTSQSLADDLARRAAKFAAARTEVPVQAGPVQAAPPRAPRPVIERPAEPPAKPFSKIFASFLEEKNIRWGELIGGLLIICSSIALVLSFWQQISARPILKFGLFNGVTAALFSLGLYVERRWRLPTTTHGILLISVLLVPLNFLAIAAFTLNDAPDDILAIGGELLSIVVFAGFTFAAGRILVGSAAWHLAAGVIVSSALELVVRRFTAADSSTAGLLALGLLPVLSFALPTMYWARRLDRGGDGAVPSGPATFGEKETNQLFKITGLTLFAALLPLGLLLAKSGGISTTLARVAPLVSLLGAPLLAVGLVLWRRLTDPALMKERVAGTAIAAAGTMAMVAAVGFGWPMPGGMLPTAVINGLVFIWVASRGGIPAAHLPAALCFTAAYLLGFHVAWSGLGWESNDPHAVFAAILSAISGTALVLPVAAFGLTALVFQRTSEAGTQRRETAKWYGIAAALTATASIGLVAYFAFGVEHDDAYATWVFALYSLAAITAGAITGRKTLGYIGSALGCAALLQGIYFHDPGERTMVEAWTWVVLIHATVSLVAMRLIVWRSEPTNAKSRDGAATPLFVGALVTSVLAVPTLAHLAYVGETEIAARGFTWVTALWGVMAWYLTTPISFAAFQAAGFVAAILWSHRGLKTEAWFSEVAGYPRVVDPRALAVYGLAATALCGVWLMARLLSRRALPSAAAAEQASKWHGLARFVHASSPTVDRAVLAAAVALVAWLAISAVVPGVCQELSPDMAAGPTRAVPPASQFELFGIAHGGAYGQGAWQLLGAAAAVTAGWLWERFAFGKLWTLLVLTVGAMLLGAARWETEVAAASAVRWGSVLLFTFLSLPLWFRRPTTAAVDRLRWPGWSGRESGLATWWFYWSLGLSLVPALAVHTVLVSSALGRFQVTIGAHIGLVAMLVVGFATIAITAVVGTARITSERTSWSMLGARLLQLSGLVLIAAVALYDITTAFATSRPIVGPDPSSLFAELGLAKSYVLPLVLLAGTLIAHAWLQRRAGIAFGAATLLNLSATIAYLLHIAHSTPVTAVGLKFDVELWLRLGQLNAVISAAFAIGWMTLELTRRKAAAHEAPPVTSWLTTQTALAAALIAPAILGPIVVLCADLYSPTWVPSAVADLPAWGAFAAVLAAAAFWFRTMREPISVAGWILSALGVVSLLVLATIPHATGQLVTFDLLIAGWLGVAFVAAGCGFAAERRGWSFGPAASVRRWVMMLALIAAIGAQYGLAAINLHAALNKTFPTPPPTPHQFLLATPFLFALLCVGLSAWGASRSKSYVAAAAICYGVMAHWFDGWAEWLLPGAWRSGDVGLMVLLISWAVPTPLWLAIERRFIAPQLEPHSGDLKSVETKRRGRLPVLSRGTGTMALVVVGWFAFVGVVRDFEHDSVGTPGALYGAAIVSMLVAVATSLWDGGANRAVALVYLAGVATVGAALDAFDIEQPRMLFYLATMFTAAYALFTSYLWSRRAGLREIGLKLGMPIDRWREADGGAPVGQGWLVVANYSLAVVTTLAAFRVILIYDDFMLRISAAHAVFGAAVGVALLAQGARRSSLQLRALEFGWVGAVALAWAIIAPGETWEFLNRAVLAVTATAAVIIVYGLGFTKLLRAANDWTAAAERLVPRLVVLAGAGLALVLGAEVFEFVEYGAVQISTLAIGAVAAALVGLTAAAITAALVPGRDPLGLNERGRMNYVYGAEAIVALLFLHIRLTLPWLFTGYFLRYWPIGVMVLAFAGVGLGEVFRRRQTNVLAEPLERTGAFLPLLPVFGFWATDIVEVHYSLLLLAVGLLYSTLAVMRKSFGFGLLAALAANGGLWYFLGTQEGYGWLEHPQLWLIPPALCVLIAAHLNRNRLKPEQITAYRYSAATVIYVASTADVFLNGVAEAPWLPLLLAGLSIAGIFAGIALRVRAFLFLGTAFLLLALMTIIWHAAYDLEQTWIFYVAGIVAGVLIIALFAVFEKKRQEILAVMEKLREWDA